MSLTASVLLLFLATNANAARGKVADRLENQIQRLMREGEVPGLSAALIRDGRVVWHGGFGVKSADGRNPEPVDEATVFEAASLSKPVFAYAVMKLIEAGKIVLDEPLVSYLREPAVPNDQRATGITARMVLAHTSGLPNEVMPELPLGIHFTPGTRFSYSGAGFLHLQRIVERITREPLEELARNTVFEPLGMTNSSFVWRADYGVRKAVGHKPSGVPGEQRRPTEAKSASSLHTTALDYARFLIAVMNGTGLSRDTAGSMLKPQVRLDEDCSICLQAVPTRLSPTLFWGLGWGLERTGNGTAFWHWGDNNAEFQSFAIAFPERREGIVILTNSGNGLSIVPAIVSRAIGGRHPAFAWMQYEPYDSPARLLYRKVLDQGVAAVARYRTSAKSHSGTRLTERQVNDLGYRLLGKKRVREAVEVFRMNADNFPGSWNAHDSLGEAYVAAGEMERAIRSYGRSLELNPGNTNARETLKRLRSERSPLMKKNGSVQR